MTGAGGIAPAGGTVGAGGNKASGGTIASGGLKAGGGTIATGGANPSGGTGGTGTGCAPDWTLCCGQCLSPAAGVCMTPCPATGGVSPTGGTPSTGGSTGVGGSKGTGGVTGTGGTGGSTGTTVAALGDELRQQRILRPAGRGLQRIRCDWNLRAQCRGGVHHDHQPVCGCNGHTYPSDCDRQVAGVSKKSDGACPTTDAGVIMTPTLPAPCQVDGDCCVAMDTCMAMAYLVGLTEYPAMVASIPSAASRGGVCLACIQPAVQVQCQGGFCAGAKLPYSSSTSALMSSHCGYISVSDAGASTGSAHAAADAGAAAGPSIWSCASP